MHINNKQRGFTLIEVVLVLAIAGLIFLIVFLALPALQRSQRDTARKNDVSRFVSQLSNFQSNSQGAIPADDTAWGTFISNYLTVGGQQFGDPQTGSYTRQVQTSATANPAINVGNIYIFPGTKCDSSTTNGVIAAGSRQVSVIMPLEQGGKYCQNN